MELTIGSVWVRGNNPQEKPAFIPSADCGRTIPDSVLLLIDVHPGGREVEPDDFRGE